MIFWFLAALIILLISIGIAYWSMKTVAKEQDDIFTKDLPPQPGQGGGLGQVLPVVKSQPIEPSQSPKSLVPQPMTVPKAPATPQTIEEAKKQLESIIAQSKQSTDPSPPGDTYRSDPITPSQPQQLDPQSIPQAEDDQVQLGTFIGEVTVKRR